MGGVGGGGGGVNVWLTDGTAAAGSERQCYRALWSTAVECFFFRSTSSLSEAKLQLQYAIFRATVAGTYHRNDRHKSPAQNKKRGK